MIVFVERVSLMWIQVKLDRNKTEVSSKARWLTYGAIIPRPPRCPSPEKSLDVGTRRLFVFRNGISETFILFHSGL